jgi:16S rRNA (guanine(966)-N(2))-methyltransferase RsmD
VREALFDILWSRRSTGDSQGPVAVLDLFAGTGALGFEALSRGAAEVCFVDSSRMAIRQIQRNAMQLQVASRTQIIADDALRALQRLTREGRRFGWIFVDPPYASELGASALEQLGRGELCAQDGVVVLEHSSRRPPAEAAGRLTLLLRRRYGDSGLSLYGVA